jgi:hypothetical protein
MTWKDKSDDEIMAELRALVDKMAWLGRMCEYCHLHPRRAGERCWRCGHVDGSHRPVRIVFPN